MTRAGTVAAGSCGTRDRSAVPGATLGNDADRAYGMGRGEATAVRDRRGAPRPICCAMTTTATTAGRRAGGGDGRLRDRTLRVVPWLLGLVALYVLSVRTQGGQALDNGGLEGGVWRIAARMRGLTDVLHVASYATLAVGALVAATGLRRSRRVDPAVRAAVIVVGAGLTAQLLKRALPRPHLPPQTLGDPSWPSGHATALMSVLLVALLLSPPSRRRVTAGVGVVIVATLGAGLLIAGWHRPSDVVAGYVLATTWTLALAPDHPSRPRRPFASRPVALTVSAVVAVGALWTVLVRVPAQPLTLRRDEYLVLASAVVGAAAVALVAVAVRALPAATPSGRHGRAAAGQDDAIGAPAAAPRRVAERAGRA